MIIPRKYELLGILYDNDKKSKKIIDKAFEEFDKKQYFTKEELLKYNYNFIPAFLNIGCGIPGEVYGKFMEGFEKLDKEFPYDNGLTFKDVSKIEFETSRKGTAIQMRFVSDLADQPYRIVGFAAIENKNNNIEINKGWEMAAPYEIG